MSIRALTNLSLPLADGPSDPGRPGSAPDSYRTSRFQPITEGIVMSLVDDHANGAGARNLRTTLGPHSRDGRRTATAP